MIINELNIICKSYGDGRMKQEIKYAYNTGFTPGRVTCKLGALYFYQQLGLTLSDGFQSPAFTNPCLLASVLRMVTPYKILTLFLWLITFKQVTAQTTYSICYIHTIKSQNNKFFLETIPFDNIEQTSTGITSVFSYDSTKIYEVDRHFELSDNRREIFLSNNGKTIAYVIDREFKWDGFQNKSIEIYKNGHSVKQFQLTDLIDCNSENEDCYLFYKESIDTVFWENGKRKITFKEDVSDFEKKLTEKATYLNNDTLYIFTKTSKLIAIDLNTINLSSMLLTKIDPEKFKEIRPTQSHIKKFKTSSLYGLPDLSSGLTFEKGLARNLGMVVFPEEKKDSYELKKYSIKVQIIVDKYGNAALDKIENYNALPEDKIKTFIESQKFAINSIPQEVGKWRFEGWIALMNKNKKEAKKEKRQEIVKEKEVYKKRIITDSINGRYIPKNIEECFLELNKILKPKDIEAIKNLKDRSETILYHHGFGTWLRNNWGLWGGSRLQQYLIKKGIDHPDSMSSIILEYYYDWLNGQNDKWKEFEAK